MKELVGIYTIWLRDLKRFFRDKPRIVGSIAQPTIYLFILGSGLANSFKIFGSSRGEDFLHFMYPGIIGMTILFSSFFSAVSIIWDREFGFLKEVLVSPISRTSIVIGKTLGGSTVALIQGSIILIFSPILKISLTPISFLKLLPIMFITAIAISSFGIALASRLQTIQSFQVITNFILLPMFFLSGAMFPLINVPKWMTIAAKINPLSYGIDAMRYVILKNSTLQLFPLYIDIIVIVAIAMVLSTISIFLFNIQD